MADHISLTFVTPLIKQALSKAASFAAEQITLAWGLEKELQELADSLTLIQGVLEDAERRQESSPAIRLFLQRLEDIAYDAVNVLDEYAYKVIQLKVETPGRISKKVRTFFSPSRFIMANEIRKIKESLVKVKGDDAVFVRLIKPGPQSHDPTIQQDRSRTDCFLPVDLKVCGREQDVLDIVRLLQDLRDKHSLSGISIVGMPGVGKTVLAKSIYKKVDEAKLYDLASWVCASEDFNVRKLLVEILEHFNLNAGAINNMNVLLQHLVKKIENKTFLLILDDVWNEDQHKWKDFISRLSTIPGLESDNEREKESEDVRGKGLESESDDEGKMMKSSITKISIVITTRVQKVASMVEGRLSPRAMHSHFVEGLATDVCWCIIKERVLRLSGKLSLPEQLECIGKDIAEKCRGLPLVAAVIGGTLGHHIEEAKWLAIRNSNAWDDIEDGSQILSVLKISYDQLGLALKKCFSYCSIFPKDFVMEKDDLVQLWMAQGFLYQANESTKTMEEIGNQHFDELLSNSLFQAVERDHFGDILSCKMHDVVHDLALFVSKGETLTWENGSNINENSNIRHLRVKYDRYVLPTIPRRVAQRLHSLFLDVDDADVFNNMALEFKSLRCLKLLGANTKELSASLGRLKHLKYLGISENGNRVLPESFSKLYNLQTLRLQGCYYVEKLPDGIRNLISLRHLCVTYREHLVDQIPSILPSGIGQLTSLQKLPLTLFDLGGEKECQIEELGYLKELGGDLYVWNLERVKSKSQATKAELKEKPKLNRLLLSWDGRSRKVSNDNDEEVLEVLQPHPNLKYLSIFGYLGEKFPLWMTDGVKGGASFQLNNLVELTLFNCNGCTCFPGVGLLPSLEVLCIKGMAKLRSMGHKFNLNRSSDDDGIKSTALYPGLRKFTLSLMYDLEEWVEVIEGEEAATGGEGISVFPCLEELLIEDCPELKTWVMGGFSSRHKPCSLTIHNCPNLIAFPNMDGITSLKISLRGCDGLGSSPPTPPSPSPPLPNFRLSPTSTLQGNSKASRN
ncbi:hypothetical protein SLA2020_322240 [Shorea laevis]